MPLYGPKWPLKRGNKDTYEVYDTAQSQISFYLKNLLLTHPGENISDPDYGVGLRSFLFEQNIEQVRGIISNRVRTQIARYLPYIIVKDILLGSSAMEIDENALILRIIYNITTTAEAQIFDLDLQQTQEIGFY